jgi:hypothetical protein
LENFDTQKDLSHRQLRWQEFLSQYEMTINYIPGKDNTVVDVLSRVALNTFPDELPPLVNLASDDPDILGSSNAILSISTDESLLSTIKAGLGYANDTFCKRVTTTSMSSWQNVNGLWYFSGRLLIP